MRVAVFSCHKFEKAFLEKANAEKHTLIFLEPRLSSSTVKLAQDCEAVSIFVNDDASEFVFEELYMMGVKFMVLRSTG